MNNKPRNKRLTMGIDDWKVGDKLYHDSHFTMGCVQIVRETKTTFVLSNKEAIRKGSRTPIGQHGYGITTYYSEYEEYGMKIKMAMIRSKKIYKITSVDWKSLPDEKLDAVIHILEEK